MNLSRLAGLYARIAPPVIAFCLAAAVLCLPVTSLPLLARLMGGTTVAPVSIVFAALGLAISLPLALFQRQTWPGEIIPLAVFGVAALASVLVSFFYTLPFYKGISPYREALQAFLTLLIGATCFLFFGTAVRKPEQFQTLFKLICIGGLAILIWGGLQWYYTYTRQGFIYNVPDWILAIHDALSPLDFMHFAYLNRVTAFAFEPSWLAHQMNCIYLPYWLGASLSGYSAFQRRIVRLSAENLLLIGGIVVSFASLSRIGYISLMLMMAFLFWRASAHFSRRISGRLGGPEKRQALIHRLLQSSILLGFLLLAGISVLILSRFDPRVGAIFTQTYSNANLFYLANNLSLAERFGFWGLGWNVFTHFPWLGTGLGNTGFFFETQLPQFGWALNEFQKLYQEFAVLPNAKNLWIRLLAETGILGTSIFLSWLYVIFASARSLFQRREPLYRTLAWMGTLAVVALLGEGFSIDSFALPYYWIAFGLAVSASFLTRTSQAAGEAPAPGKD